MRNKVCHSKRLWIRSLLVLPLLADDGDLRLETYPEYRLDLPFQLQEGPPVRPSVASDPPLSTIDNTFSLEAKIQNVGISAVFRSTMIGHNDLDLLLNALDNA